MFVLVVEDVLFSYDDIVNGFKVFIVDDEVLFLFDELLLWVD